MRASALASIAGALAATDPDRAARLIDDAERAAQSFTHGYSKASALVSIAGVLAASDPDRAARLIDDAERAAQSITDSSTRATVLVSIAGALAAIRPGPLNFSLPFRCNAVDRGHWRRPTDFGGRIRSMPYSVVAALVAALKPHRPSLTPERQTLRSCRATTMRHPGIVAACVHRPDRDWLSPPYRICSHLEDR